VDVAARYGGEEFAFILPDTRAAGAGRFAESVRLAIADLELPHPSSPVAPVLTVSVGVATATLESHSTPEELIAAADQALYRAKKNGRNRVDMAWREGVSGEGTNVEVLSAVEKRLLTFRAPETVQPSRR
jgi:diguanylate cyclase (GGDEF)-like protein